MLLFQKIHILFHISICLFRFYVTILISSEKTEICSIKDDAIDIEKNVLNADVIAFATPIYYYEMSGQMKTLLNRMNPLYPKYYKFREVYMLSVAAENKEYVS